MTFFSHCLRKIGIICLIPIAFVIASPKPGHTQSFAIASAAVLGSAVVGSVIDKDAELLRLSGKLIVTSVTHVGEGSIIILKSVATGAEVSLKLAGEIGHSALLFAGKSIEVILVSTGRILVAGGRVIAYIAEQGRPDYYHSSLHGHP